MIKKSIKFALAVTLVGLFYVDSYRFFSRDYVQVKLQHRSGLYDWNIHFPQSVVYHDSSLRYQQDFKDLKEIIDEDSLLISDMATSYYAAALLPVYIRNTQRHHGRQNFQAWSSIFDRFDFCYLDNPNSAK